MALTAGWLPVNIFYPSSLSTPWHQASAGDICLSLGTDPAHGLAGGEAAERLAKGGPNAFPEPSPTRGGTGFSGSLPVR